MKKQKELEQKRYVFTDDFAFGFVMRDKNICRGMLERIIPEVDFSDIRFDLEPNPLFSDGDELDVEAQKTLNFDADAKGVRFDAYTKSKKLWAEIEMQTYTGENIAKRSRYYQANMDMDALEKGAKYDTLTPTYVIFICTFDYLKKGKPVYFFQHYDTKNNLPLDDETYIIILNTSCNLELVPDRLKPLFIYINNPARIEDSFIETIERRVQEFNTPKWRRKQMTLEHLLDNKLEQGRAEGEEKGRMEEKISNARGMIEEGLSDAVIEKITKLSKEQIAQLRTGM